MLGLAILGFWQAGLLGTTLGDTPETATLGSTARHLDDTSFDERVSTSFVLPWVKL